MILSDIIGEKVPEMKEAKWQKCIRHPGRTRLASTGVVPGFPETYWQYPVLEFYRAMR